MLERQLWRDKEDKELFAMAKSRASARHNAEYVRGVRGQSNRASGLNHRTSGNNHGTSGDSSREQRVPPLPVPTPDYPSGESEPEVNSVYSAPIDHVIRDDRIMTSAELRDDISDFYPLTSPYQTGPTGPTPSTGPTGDNNTSNHSDPPVNIFPNQSRDAISIPVNSTSGRSHRTSEIIWT